VIEAHGLVKRYGDTLAAGYAIALALIGALQFSRRDA
jgi:hypothetical protein